MAARPNVLVLIADDHRADALSAFGHPSVRTPALDRLAASGTALRNAFTTVPICTPARAELLSGADAFRCGVRFFGEAIRPEFVWMPQAFANAGYLTFFVGKWHNDGRPEERGFALARRVFPRGMGPHWMRFSEDGGTVEGFSSELFAEAAIEFLHRPSDRPWFAYVAFTAPHDPRTPPAGYRYDPGNVPLPANYMPEHPFDNGEMVVRDERLERWPRTQGAIRRHLADYYGMITHLDAQIGRILQALEETHQAERTIVLYLSDHGLAVGSHGLMGKQNMYDHSVRVPAILRGPGVPAGEERAGLCFGFDLYPTLCELAGIPVPETVQGRSLLPLLDGAQRPVREAVFGAYREVQRMIRTDRWKYIEYPEVGRAQLFDLQNDPHELRDLLLRWRIGPEGSVEPEYTYDGVQAEAAALRERLRRWQREVQDPSLSRCQEVFG